MSPAAPTFNWPIHHFWSFNWPAVFSLQHLLLIGLYTISGHLAWTAVFSLQHLLTVHTMYSTIVQCHCSTQCHYGHFNWPIHYFWSCGLDCSILPAAPNYSTYNVQHHDSMTPWLHDSMTLVLYTVSCTVHSLLYCTQSLVLYTVSCTAPSLLYCTQSLI